METILFFFTQGCFLLLNFFLYLNVFLSKCFINFKESTPAAIYLLVILKTSCIILLKSFNFILSLKFILLWFPNINPFTQPYFIVYVITEPVLAWLSKRLPRLYNIDLSFLVCSLAVNWLISYFTKLKF